MKHLTTFGGSLGYREDLMIPTFDFLVGKTEQNNFAEVDMVSMD
jgi:hypothetical protein